MTHREWYEWLRELPWSLRWFPLLIVVRPLVDNFYFLKEVSPFLSPPYIVGVLTPVLAVSAMVKYRMPKLNSIDKVFLYWGITVLFSCAFLIFYDPLSLLSIEFVLKLSLPVYIYFFLRLFITELRDLHGILQAFLYGSIFVGILLIYEVAVIPFRIEESRGLSRIQGNFGDVVSYGMYITFSAIVATYYFFSRQHILSLRRRLWLLIPVALVGVLGLVNIHHTATYTIFILVIGLFVAFNIKSRNRSVAILLLIIIGISLSIWGSEVVDERITPLLQTDLAVYSGTQDTDKLLHGRVGRWRMMLTMFSSENIAVQFFGYPIKLDYVYHFIGIGSHNDFVRILFATGVVGLTFYIIFLVSIFKRALALPMAQRYLLIATLIALLFYSISVTPTIYAPFMYFALAIFAYVGLPDNQLSKWKNRAY
ncbi:MAG: hypothetical protein LC664_00710 [Flavobacteriales bacterium]|nr:hypothetical protein [Flavobacteriales bacterium]